MGATLLKDAVTRTRLIAHHAGVRALLVDTNDHVAVRFYQKYGFLPSSHKPSRLLLKIRAPSP